MSNDDPTIDVNKHDISLEEAKDLVAEVTTKIGNVIKESEIFPSFPQKALELLNNIKVVELKEFLDEIHSSPEGLQHSYRELIGKYKHAHSFIVNNNDSPKILINASAILVPDDLNIVIESITMQVAIHQMYPHHQLQIKIFFLKSIMRA
jgi:hypothetical protein